MHSVIDFAVPVAVFVVSFAALMLVRNIILSRIEKWAHGKTWPVDAILLAPIKLPSAVLCLVVGVYLGIAVSPISSDWKGPLGSSFLTFFILAVMLAVINTVQGAITFFATRLSLPGAAAVISTVFIVGIIVVGGLIILGIWGAPTSPLLFVISGASLAILLALRDTGPDYVAAMQLAIWERVKVGESIKLQDDGQGLVTKMGWHSVEILTRDGHTLLIPNNKIIKQIVTKFKESPEAVKESLEFFEKQTATAPCDPSQKEDCDDLATILSKREMEIAELVSRGATNKELAKTLFISENTAKAHVKNILHKLELKNRQQLAVMAASRTKPTK